MSIHNAIVVSADPKGHFIEGIIEGTPKPGTMMMLKAATEPVAGKHTYVVWNGAADGEQDEVIVLLPDTLSGQAIDTAYVSGERGFMYIPVAGDEIKCLVANIAGTADAFAIGDKLIIDDGTGKMIATTGTPEMEPFKVLETVAAITEDTLVLCRKIG